MTGSWNYKRKNTVRSQEISAVVLNDFIMSSKRLFEIIESQLDLKESASDAVIINVPGDGFAALGASPSAGTVMTKFCPIHMGPEG